MLSPPGLHALVVFTYASWITTAIILLFVLQRPYLFNCAPTSTIANIIFPLVVYQRPFFSLFYFASDFLFLLIYGSFFTFLLFPTVVHQGLLFLLSGIASNCFYNIFFIILMLVIPFTLYFACNAY